jgi:hypothetical protein
MLPKDIPKLVSLLFPTERQKLGKVDDELNSTSILGTWGRIQITLFSSYLLGPNWRNKLECFFLTGFSSQA